MPPIATMFAVRADEGDSRGRGQPAAARGVRPGSRWTRGWRCILLQVNVGGGQTGVWVAGRWARAPDRFGTTHVCSGFVCGTRANQPDWFEPNKLRQGAARYLICAKRAFHREKHVCVHFEFCFISVYALRLYFETRCAFGARERRAGAGYRSYFMPTVQAVPQEAPRRPATAAYRLLPVPDLTVG